MADDVAKHQTSTSREPKRPRRGDEDVDTTSGTKKNERDDKDEETTTEESGSGGIIEMDTSSPKYNGEDFANEVFANPYFYNNKQSVVDAYEVERKQVFGENETVEDVRRKYEKKDNGFALLAREIGANPHRVKHYFDGADVISIEQLLADEGILALTGMGEVEAFRDRNVENLPSPKALFETHARTADERTNPLCFVLGSSGSGKTFLSLQHLKDFRNDKKLERSVTIYLRPSEFDDIDYADEDNSPAKLVERIQTDLAWRLKSKFQRVWQPTTHSSKTLMMHVCIVLDEAGARSLRGFFEKKAVIVKLLATLTDAQFADSFLLVVCGTGVTGRAFDSTKEAYFFRLKPWKQDDVKMMIAERFLSKSKLTLKSGESVDTLVNAIYSHPLLEALTTNARSAYFLVKAIAIFSNGFTARSDSWYVTLGDWMPTLVEQVVIAYASSNGIQSLNDSERCRVAAWVFRALASKQMNANLPEFDGLEEDERRVAFLLLQVNVEGVGGNQQLLNGELFPVTVTPAIAIVLFHMAGVTARMRASWKGEEDVAALYSARQWILKQLEIHIQTKLKPLQKRFGRNKQTLEEFETSLAAQGKINSYQFECKVKEKEFGQSLEALRLFRLKRRIQPNDGDVLIPRVTSHSILVNGDMAAFADVIAPYTLLQAKHISTSGTVVQVDLEQELSKCCLLCGCRDDRVLRGLLAIWTGEYDGSFGLVDDSKLSADSRDTSELQRSNAFPENLTKVREAVDPLSYVSIKKSLSKHTYVDNKSETDITSEPVIFILSTNVRKIKIILPKPLPNNEKVAIAQGSLTDNIQVDESNKETVFITHESLTDDMQVDEALLSEPAKAAWTSFRTTQIRKGVIVKFLFTMQV